MELSFRHIDEKDVDVLVMDRLSSGGEVLGLLLGEVGDEMPGGANAFQLAKIAHSAATCNGESDLLIAMSKADYHVPCSVHPGTLCESRIPMMGDKFGECLGRGAL